jgi:pimeloyl-ACP methyl ester carboxylesterase
VPSEPERPLNTDRRRIALPDGRTLDVLTAGPSDGLPLVLHEGTPVGLVLYPPTVRAAEAYGLRVSIAGVAPYRAKGLDFLAGMGQENVDEFGAAVQGEAALTAFLDSAAAALGAVTGADVAQALGGLVIAADQAVLTGEFADHVAASLRAGVSTGIAGWRDDDLAFAKDWGFSFDGETPAAPVAIWQGDQDKMVPFAHGQWLAANIPGAHAHLLPGEGHLSLTVSSLDRILADLLDLAGLKP